jgi:protein tyrosine/serine phosphatase
MPSYANIATQVDPVSEPKFVYYGMKDDDIASSLDELRALIKNLVKRVQEDGEILYIHCKGGSGRTGIVVACLLGSLYPQLSADEALLRTQRYFEMRAKGAGKWVNPKHKSPATVSQMDQVREFFHSVVTEEMVEEGSSQRCDSGGFCVIM